MTSEVPSPAEFARGFNAFFRAAFDGKTGLTLDRLRTLFDRHITMEPAHAQALFERAATEPTALADLGRTLKKVADQAHCNITGCLSDSDVLAYTLNTLADGLQIVLSNRFPVALPHGMESHGDSLFAHEGQKSEE